MFRGRRPVRVRKCNSVHKMESMRKRAPDHTDFVYRDAVSRLRFLLAESYQPACKFVCPPMRLDEADADNAVIPVDRSRPILRRGNPVYADRHTVYLTPPLKYFPHVSPSRSVTFAVPPVQEALPAPPPPDNNVPPSTATSTMPPTQQPPGELMTFIERQEEYIDHLEKESQYCRDELTNLMGKVKDLITENEDLHDAHKTTLIRSGTDNSEEEEDSNHNNSDNKSPRKRVTSIEGPSIVFESRISELEAQLTQARVLQRKAQDEADSLRRQLAESQSSSNTSPVVDALQRERDELARSVAKLQETLAQFREKEADATSKVKKSLNVVDQAQFEKNQAESEVRRLRDELERQHEKLREVLHDQSRRVQEAERRYSSQVEQLTADLATQWDLTSRLQLDVDKQRRVEAELRRELTQKNNLVEDMRKELNAKIGSLQTELLTAATSKGNAEQELSEARLHNERAERAARQEVAKLQTEIAALRQRLDRADAESLHSRRENLRLMEQIASLEKEVNLAKMLKETHEKQPVAEPTSDPERQKELTSMLLDMDAKHAQTVAELENMIQSQNRVMDKLRRECENLTSRLEESTARHKKEMEGLQSNLNYLSNKVETHEGQEWRGGELSRHGQQNQPAAESLAPVEQYDGMQQSQQYSDSREPDRETRSTGRQPTSAFYEQDQSRSNQPEYSDTSRYENMAYDESETKPTYDESAYSKEGEAHPYTPGSQDQKEYQMEEHQSTAPNLQQEEHYGAPDNQTNQRFNEPEYTYDNNQQGTYHPPDPQYQQPYGETQRSYHHSNVDVPESRNGRPLDSDSNPPYSNNEPAGSRLGTEDVRQGYEYSDQSNLPRARFEEEPSRSSYEPERQVDPPRSDRRMSRTSIAEHQRTPGGYSSRAPESTRP